ncbi:YqzL family protein [Microaerobacter geothermalis]|nr:YqzL family protein [Microaerobacter geothermalis]MCF6092819.1 YqzL family protein [Microaerobacter geothermalis]
MRDFSWKYFEVTGDIEAYLLYKDIHGRYRKPEESVIDDSTEEGQPE